MDFRFIKNYSNVTQEATMLLYDEIGGDSGINGNYFASELFYLDQNGCKKVNVRINSPGGRIIDGYSIFSAIQNTKCRVDTYNDGLAASIAGIIFQAGKKRYMADYSILMMHNPQGSVSNSKESEVMNLWKSSLSTILSNKTGMNQSSIDAMMSEETWMDSSQCLEKKFTDEVYSTVRKPKLEMAENSVKKLWQISNSFLNNNKKMLKVTNLLGLAVEANEDSIALSIQNLLKTNKEALEAKNALEVDLTAKKAELEEANNSLVEINKKLKEKEDSEKAALLEVATNKANTLVDGAIKIGKIANTAKDAWVKMAVENHDNTKALIDAIPLNKKSPDFEDVDNSVKTHTMAGAMAEIRNRTEKK